MVFGIIFGNFGQILNILFRFLLVCIKIFTVSFVSIVSFHYQP